MTENRENLFIKNGSEIAIIGGGPAGSLFAKFACENAKRSGIDVHVTIYSGRRFSEKGPRGCKGCVGVINEPLNEKLRQAGMELPEELIMQRIDRYCFAAKGGELYVKKRTKLNDIVTLFRGHGPVCSPANGGFDSFLLEHARNSGAEVIQESVRDVIFPGNKEDKITIICDEGSRQVDLLVGAFGVRSPIMKKFGVMGYRPPGTARACIVEIDCGEQHVKEVFENTIHIYSLGEHGIDYGIMIPKKKFITVAIVGKNVRLKDVQSFLSRPPIAKMLPVNPKICCRCCTSIPVTAPEQPYGDRVLIIGDAGYSRYYKNGLESAFNSAQIAAGVAFENGISKRAFEKHYYPVCKKMFITENFYGRMLFGLNRIISSNEILSIAHIDIAKKDEKRGHEHLNAIQWNMFTGHDSYRNIFRDFFEPGLQLELAVMVFKESLERVRKKCRLR